MNQFLYRSIQLNTILIQYDLIYKNKIITYYYSTYFYLISLIFWSK